LSRVLITGGSGDLGRVLSRRAVAAGYDVTAAYLSRPDRITAGKPIRLDLCDPAAVRQALDQVQPDFILHTAVNQKLSDSRQQIIDMAHHLDKMRQPGSYLIMLSSDMVFDGSRPPYREDDPPSPLTAYGEAKAEIEGVGDCVVRTSLIYDFEPGNKQVDWLLDKIAKGEKCRLFRDEYRSPIWAVNLVDALLELAGNRTAGIVNVAGPQRMSRLELGRGLLDGLGYNADEHTESVSQAGTGRPRDLTLDVSKAQRLLKTPLWTFDEARDHWKADRGAGKA
jgi:dTDP-4-dehydrorhamnose reductase